MTPHWSIKDQFVRFFWLADRGIRHCKEIPSSNALRQIQNDPKRYDVILIEHLDQDCLMGLAWKLQASVIGLSSCLMRPWHYDRFGNPLIPSYIPNLFMSSSDKMTFVERLENWIMIHSLRLLHR